ncbi:hypothetical protein L1987_10250 [Smallanthus sonchifolius]|uniref:Uncharacterized protein n=1 Tax=Smallanthus sonchifolius TaxID=185202 RepID=A0ACB9JRQ8_9ASTR|nr:hypothetical protein L1987_10250 [Smallanthus sonchifolius]
MAELNKQSGSSHGQLKGTKKRTDGSSELASPESGSGSGSGPTNGVPCGACKFMRRRCVDGCIFAPHFSPEQGTALFAGVHRVFGGSNVSKLLMHLPVHHRQHAVETILYEAQARLSDPVYGCVSVIIGLQQQIATLQIELAMVQNQLINNKLMVPNALQGSLQQPEPVHHHDLQPVYSSGPSSSNYNMNIYDSSLHNHANENQNALQSQLTFDLLQLSQPSRINEDDVEVESGTL